VTHVTRRKHYWIAGVILSLIAVGLVNYHWSKFGLDSHWHVIVNSLACLSLLGQLAMAHLNKDFDAEETSNNRLNLCVVIPAYNEDPVTFKAMLKSMVAQLRRPDFVYVIDDGSDSKACRDVFDGWDSQGIPAQYFRQSNQGKRSAQGHAFGELPNADVFITVDSDTVLDSLAVSQGIKPFLADKRVKGVAGLLLGLNWNKNLLTRLVDLSFVSSFVSGRASWSRLRSVSVCCGGLAFYSADVVQKHLDEYVNQEVFHRRASCGDDRVMTNFALLEGWVVFQESSAGYTLHPERLSHLTKQRIRWWRSFFWGSEWLSRRMSPKKIAWWLVVGLVADTAVFTCVLVFVVPYILISGVAEQHIPLALLIYIGFLGYVRNIRYMAIRRPDQTFWQQLRTYALSPLAVLLNTYLCTVLSYVGLATVRNNGWSTRKKVEVGLEKAPGVTSPQA
jgi:hyaluronan synthase